MQIWQLQEAKAKLTKVMNEAKIEPQIISRHGVCESVVLSMDKYKELSGMKEDIVTFFTNSPLKDIDIEFERDKSFFMREVDL